MLRPKSTSCWLSRLCYCLSALGFVVASCPETQAQLSAAPKARLAELDSTAAPGVKQPVITAVAILPGGEMISTAGDDHLVRLWSTETTRVVRFMAGHSDWVRTLAFSPDGQHLASAGDDRQIIYWHVATGKQVMTLPRHRAAVYSIAFSPDGLQLAAVGFAREVAIYNLQTGQRVRELVGPGDDLRSVAFSPDERQLIAAGRSGQIRAWDAQTGTVQWDANTVQGRIRTLAYLPDGDKLASGGEGRAINIWNASDGSAVSQLPCPGSKVMSMVVCGENLISTGGSDNLVHVWNWQTQAEVDRFTGHTGSVAALAFDPQSRTIISAGFDTTIRVWRLGNAGSQPTAAAWDTSAR